MYTEYKAVKVLRDAMLEWNGSKLHVDTRCGTLRMDRIYDSMSPSPTTNGAAVLLCTSSSVAPGMSSLSVMTPRTRSISKTACTSIKFQL